MSHKQTPQKRKRRLRNDAWHVRNDISWNSRLRPSDGVPPLVRATAAQRMALFELAADRKFRKVARALLLRATAAGHVEAMATCDRYLDGDESASNDIQQGMKDWGI